MVAKAAEGAAKDGVAGMGMVMMLESAAATSAAMAMSEAVATIAAHAKQLALSVKRVSSNRPACSGL